MKDNILIARLSSLLEEEDPFVKELILHTVEEVETKNLSVDAHARQIGRMLDFKLQQMEEDSQ